MDPGPPQLPSPTDSRPPRLVPAKSHDTPACAGYRPGTPQEASGTPSKGYTIRLVNAIPASFIFARSAGLLRGGTMSGNAHDRIDHGMWSAIAGRQARRMTAVTEHLPGSVAALPPDEPLRFDIVARAAGRAEPAGGRPTPHQRLHTPALIPLR